MIAIFKTSESAIEFSQSIHTLLKKNRVGYNAEKWSNTNKSDNENKWCVSLPKDYKEIELSIKGIDVIDKLPDNWKNVVEDNLI